MPLYVWRSPCGRSILACRHIVRAGQCCVTSSERAGVERLLKRNVRALNILLLQIRRQLIRHHNRHCCTDRSSPGCRRPHGTPGSTCQRTHSSASAGEVTWYSSCAKNAVLRRRAADVRARHREVRRSRRALQKVSKRIARKGRLEDKVAKVIGRKRRRKALQIEVPHLPHIRAALERVPPHRLGQIVAESAPSSTASRPPCPAQSV